jgi:[ribosomal protein S5]-alanine N-acetyltransferase
MGRSWLPPILETERIRLRPITDADGDAIFSICSNPAVTHHTLWETHETFFDTYFFIHEYARGRYLEEVPDPMAIVKDHPSGEVILGTVGIFWTTKLDGVMELGYFIGQPYQSVGYATEACRLLLKWTWANYPAERIQVRIMDGNAASVRVAEKLGFQYEGKLRSLIRKRGILRDVLIYSMLRTEIGTLDVVDGEL